MEYVDGPSLRQVLRDMAQQARTMPVSVESSNPPSLPPIAETAVA